MKISVGISNRHVHLNREDIDLLFGKDYTLKFLKKINQPGQYSCVEMVSIMTDKARIDNVRVLGPIRDYTQVEISRTDAYKLGINPPIRKSGDLEGSEAITIIGPKGIVRRQNCCIQANRHIHITNEELIKYNFKEDEVVSLKVSGEKGGILENVTFKVDNDSFFEVHLDTDDANAFMLKNGDLVEIIKNLEWEFFRFFYSILTVGIASSNDLSEDGSVPLI